MDEITRKKTPNLLLVGAAKSGTTSLYYYLNQHPEIFMSAVKEPRFFSSQFLNFPHKGIQDEERDKLVVKNQEDYFDLFQGAGNQKIIGEASTDNLYFHDKCIPLIKEMLGDPRILMVLRNPIERCFSNYTFFVREGREKLSFEEALKAEEARISENWHRGWFYQDNGFYYGQVKSYLDNFSQVGIFLQEDLRTNAERVMHDIYSFLGVDAGFKPDTSFRHNVSGLPKNNLKSRAINYSLTRMRNYYLLLSQNIGTKGTRKTGDNKQETGLREKVVRYTEGVKRKNLEKPEMKPETREYLKSLYREDILKLQDLIGQDLSHWLD